MFKLAVILLASTQVLVSQALVPRLLPTVPCATPDLTAPTCETSDGSPLVSDCQAAIAEIASTCKNGNSVGSKCSTIVTHGTCKIDACGTTTELADGVNCGGYLQSVLNSCQSNGKVGGFLKPASCNRKDGEDIPQAFLPYKLQFSHS